MGEHEGWAQGGGEEGALSPNGLLPNAGPLIEVLDTERWIKAEARTAELIACIQPNQPSEERRNAVADYVQRLIMKCFPCQVFTFGSVPLKTYLPDGDIDLTAFSNNQNLKDTWATEVRDMLEIEEKNKDAEFNVKEVQYIQAEVKIIKCLVENIIVDISFNQLGGLCTLCFLEEVDNLINQNHLFKRSIILIKAWCYYESRILGAHHGLISTYALETLVLYIFHVYNNSFSGPLEVLFRFLEFFSNFDWDNFCVSLWGPVPISSLPDINAEPPRKDSGELLLSKPFLDACSHVYAVFPGGQENQAQSFLSKSFNVIDPLRITNNLGRSVSKGNFFRIRSALAYGAKRLARLLNCPKENLVSEVNKFFHNTWDRHGSGVRPDAPDIDLRFGLSKLDNVPYSEIGKNNFSGKNESSGRETEVVESQSHNFIHQHSNSQSESMSKSVNMTSALRAQSQKSFGSSNNSRMSDKIARGAISNQLNAKEQRAKSDQLVNDIQKRFLFARTRSSPELTDSYGDLSSHGRRNRTSETGKSQQVNLAEDNSGSNSHYQNRRKNLEPEQPSLMVRTSDDASTARQAPMHQSLDTASDLNNSSNHYHPDSGSGAVGEELSSIVGSQGMHQEEQDLVNMMASMQGFNGQIHMPMNYASGHLPFPVLPSFLASMGLAQRNLAGMFPTNFPLINPAFSNLQIPHGFVSPQLAQYFSGNLTTANSEDSVDPPGNGNFGSAEMNSGDADNDFWQEPDVNSPGGPEPGNGNFEMLHSDDKHKLASTSYNYVPPPRRMSGMGALVRSQQKNTKEKRRPVREDHLDQFMYQDNRGNEVYSDERTSSSRLSSAAHSNSLRSKTSSESSWDEPSTVPKAMKEKRGKKLLPAEQSTGYAKGKTMSEQISMPAEDNDQDWNPLPHVATEMVERSSGPQSLATMHVARPHIPGYESAQTSGSDSMTPMPPMILEPGSKQINDNSLPLTFYPTGPPVPFLTMLPFNYVQSESGTSDASTSHFGAEESSESGDVGHNFLSSDGLDQSEDFSTNDSLRGASPGETSEDHKSDILHSDFVTHYQNLQFGRFCQSPMPHGPTGYPSPAMVPPMYLQGRVPWDGPGRPLSANMNVFTQLMNYGPRLVPVAPLQSVSNRPPNVYQRYADDLPRFRTGTGTYLPNPKVSARDRHSSGPRRGNYNYDRIDNHGEREGNWSGYQRSRPASRNHNRSQAEKSSSRMDRLAAGESRERPVSSPRHEAIPSYQSQNGPLRPSSSQSGPANVAYGMYPLPAGTPSGLSPNGQNGPSVVMVYPYDHNGGYVSHNEQLEFGSMGPMGFSGTNDQSTLSEGSRSRGSLEEHRYYGGSIQRSSPDQPSSPHHQRRI